MSLSETFRRDDRDRQFADCGESVLLELVEIAYQPETQQAHETVETLERVAIPLQREGRTARGTGGHEQQELAAWRFRREDWPAAQSGKTRRILAADQRYRIVGEEFDTLGCVVVVRGERWA